MWSDAWPFGIAAAALLACAAAAIAAHGASARASAFATAGMAAAIAAAVAAAVALAFRWLAPGYVAPHAPFDRVLLSVLGASFGTALLLRRAAGRAAESAERTARLRAAVPAALLGFGLALVGLDVDPTRWDCPPAAQAPLSAPHYALRAAAAGLLLVAGAAACARLADWSRGAGAGEAWDRVLGGAVTAGLPPFVLAMTLGAVLHRGITGALWEGDVAEVVPFAALAMHLAWVHLRTVSARGSPAAALVLAAAGLLICFSFVLGSLPGALQSRDVYPLY